MNRTTPRLGAVACAAVLALSLAGCGGDKPKASASPTPSAPPPLSAADYRVAANALCKTANEEVEKIGDGADLDTTEGAQTALTEYTGRIEQLVTDIRTLTPPVELTDGVTKMLNAVTDVVDKARTEGARYLVSGNPFAEADRQAVSIGLPDCASGSPADPTPLSATELKLQANGICKTANERMDAIEPGKNPTTSELDDTYRSLGTMLLDEVVELQRLVPPTELAGKYASFLESLTEAANTVKEEGSGTVNLEENPFLAPTTKAKALGLNVCVRG